jgi:hypothetical protein
MRSPRGGCLGRQSLRALLASHRFALTAGVIVVALGLAGGGPDKSPHACNGGVGAGDLHYSFMGDLPLEECQAKCEELDCPCFDFAGASVQARKGEHCRVCNKGSVVVPLRHSNWGYKAVIHTESAWGMSFLTVVVGSAMLYFGVGYVYNSRTGGTTGAHALPHARYWVELHGLVFDGVAYARNGGRRTARSGYRPVERVMPRSDSTTEKSSRKSKGGPSKQKSGSGRSKREKRSSKEHSVDQTTAPAVALVAGDDASPVTSPVGTVPVGTASAGGGRWVHIPN